MPSSPYLLFVLIITIWALLFHVLKKQRQKIAEAGKTKELEAGEKLAGSITYSITGIVFIIVIFVNWSSVPPGNEIFAVGVLVVGALLLLYGLYQGYRLKQQRNKER